MSPTPPTPTILAAFSLPPSPPVPLPGGQGTSYLTSTTVLKLHPPTEVEEAEWTSHTLSLLPPSPYFTIPQPIRATTGEYVYRNWSAAEFCPGTDCPVGRWRELFDAAREFHKALEGVKEPVWLGGRTHPWARGDRVAWDEEAISISIITPSLLPLYQRLLTLRKEVVTSSPQLVHGDLSGNILFPSDDSGPPVIIDFSPFFRPVAYSLAIAVVDGIADFGADAEELVGIAGLRGGDGEGEVGVQMLTRALIFRVVARSELVGVMGEVREREMEGFERVRGVIERLVAGDKKDGAEVIGARNE